MRRYSYQSDDEDAEAKSGLEEQGRTKTTTSRKLVHLSLSLGVAFCLVAGILVLAATTGGKAKVHDATDVESLVAEADPYACGAGVSYVRWDEGRIYFPASRDTGSRKFPIVVFAHGTATVTYGYKYLYCAVARQGFIIAAPEGPQVPFTLANPVKLFWDLLGLLQYWKSFGAELLPLAEKIQSSPQFSPVAGESLIVGGHSAGGGSALFSAASGGGWSGMFLLAPFTTTKRAAEEAAEKVTIPALVIEAGLDVIVTSSPFGGTPEDIIESFPKGNNGVVPKNITRGSHCGFCNACSACNSAQWAACKFSSKNCNDFISKEAQQTETERILFGWMSRFK